MVINLCGFLAAGSTRFISHLHLGKFPFPAMGLMLLPPRPHAASCRKISHGSQSDDLTVGIACDKEKLEREQETDDILNVDRSVSEKTRSESLHLSLAKQVRPTCKQLPLSLTVLSCLACPPTTPNGIQRVNETHNGDVILGKRHQSTDRDASNEILEKDELVVLRLYKSNGKCSSDRLFKLSENADYIFGPSSSSSISSESIIGRSFTDEGHLEVKVESGCRISIRRPILSEYLGLLRRNTAAATPKVLFGIFASLGVQKGFKVLEAGSGSGISTIILSSLVGETGHVTSVDLSKRNHVASERNFHVWMKTKSLRHVTLTEINSSSSSNVTFVCDDVSRYVLSHSQERFDLTCQIRVLRSFPVVI